MLEALLAKQMVPDQVIRWGIRRLLGQRLKEISAATPAEVRDHFLQVMRSSPIAVHTSDANEQHYQVPTEFYLKALGPNLKYSCGLWETGDNLARSEERMLELTCERAGLRDGMEILELGCGWGSLTLWMAKRYPTARITAVSNSATQRAHILRTAEARGLANVDVITSDMNVFQTEKKFDRVVSVEMFEHMRNWPMLLERVASWLHPKGRLFVHIFVHKSSPYLFEVKDASDWMSRYFFSGGIMPSFDLLPLASSKFQTIEKWKVNGNHYAKTCEAWLEKTDEHRRELKQLFEAHYGAGQGTKWLEWWRIFFMACAELFKYDGGDEWFVGHYLLEVK